MSDTLTFRLPRRTLLAGLAGLLLPGSARAQSYPSNVIRIVVPAGAGTPPDIISRMIANELGAVEGWRLVVEDRPGALQTIAMNDVGNHPADGYSLLTMSLPITVTPTLFPKAEIRPDVDFDPVIKISRSYTVLVTTPSLRSIPCANWSSCSRASRESSISHRQDSEHPPISSANYSNCKRGCRQPMYLISSFLRLLEI
jgi:tripartite-type tricarboxylate transporter receptor subunit TctC